MKSLIGKEVCVFDTIGDKELYIAIDVTHEPYSIIALKLLKLLREELQEIDMEMPCLDDTIDLLSTEPKGGIQ